MNSPGGYVYVLYGEDTFGRDEAVQTLKERMRALPAGEHNLTEFGPETTVAALRLAASVRAGLLAAPVVEETNL